MSLSRTFLMETAVRQDGDAYVVDGVKHFCTMALGASHYMVWCALDGGTDMSKALLQVLVPADAPGIATDGKWNTLGMRATFSPSVTFTGVRVPKDAALGDPGAGLRVGVVESFALGYAAVYLGIAEGALAFAIDYAQASASSSPRTSRSPTIPPCNGTSASCPRTSTAPCWCWPTPPSAGRPPTSWSAASSPTRPSTSPPRSASRSPPG